MLAAQARSQPDVTAYARVPGAGLDNSISSGGSSSSGIHRILSIFGSFASRRHLDNPGHEAGDRAHEVFLGCHDFVDILVDERYFVQTGGDQRDALLLQILLRL